MPLRNLSVVLVEDDKMLAEMIFMFLHDAHADVTHYKTVDDAIAHPDWGNTDAAVIDWMLPERTGDELAAWLAENHPDVRRVLITASPQAFRMKHRDLDVELISKGSDERGEFPWSLMHTLRLRRGGKR